MRRADDLHIEPVGIVPPIVERRGSDHRRRAPHRHPCSQRRACAKEMNRCGALLVRAAKRGLERQPGEQQRRHYPAELNDDVRRRPKSVAPDRRVPRDVPEQSDRQTSHPAHGDPSMPRNGWLRARSCAPGFDDPTMVSCMRISIMEWASRGNSPAAMERFGPWEPVEILAPPRPSSSFRWSFEDEDEDERRRKSPEYRRVWARASPALFALRMTITPLAFAHEDDVPPASIFHAGTDALDRWIDAVYFFFRGEGITANDWPQFRGPAAQRREQEQRRSADME